jgi:hypothetical protein
VLTFTVAPDFEAPGDVGANNVYDVTVQVSDGNGGVDTQAISITARDLQDGLPQLPPTPPPQPDPVPTPDPRPDPTTEPPSDPNSPAFSDTLSLQSTTGREIPRGPSPHSVPDWSNVLELPVFLRPASYGTTTEQLRSFYPDSLMISSMELGDEFLQQLNSFSDNLEETAQKTIEERSFFIKTMKFAGLGLSAAMIGWLLRSGTLLASLLASLPAWRNFDPIAILNMDKKSRESWARKLKEAEHIETREHQGFNKIFEAKTVIPSPPSSRTRPRSL